MIVGAVARGHHELVYVFVGFIGVQGMLECWHGVVGVWFGSLVGLEVQISWCWIVGGEKFYVNK